MPEASWWTHLINLLERSWHALLASLGTTQLAIGIAVVLLILPHVWQTWTSVRSRYSTFTWVSLKDEAFRSLPRKLGTNVIFALLIWTLLFCYFVAATIYEDHMALVREIKRLHSANSTLIRTADAERDRLLNEIQSLQQKLTALGTERPQVRIAHVPRLQNAKLAARLRAFRGIYVDVQNSPAREIFGDDLRATVALADWKSGSGNTIVDPARFAFHGTKVLVNVGPVSDDDVAAAAAKRLAEELRDQNFAVSVITSEVTLPKNWLRIIVGDQQ